MKELLLSLTKFHKDVALPKRDAQNPYFHSKYTSLEELYQTIKEPLIKNGLWYYHTVNSDFDEEANVIIAVETTLEHIETGQNIKANLKSIPIKNDPQVLGSLISYYKRYTLQALLGIPSEDDDANAASNKTHIHQEPKKEEVKIEYKIDKEKLKQAQKDFPLWLSDIIDKSENVYHLENIYKKYAKMIETKGLTEMLINKCATKKEELLKKMDQARTEALTEKETNIKASKEKYDKKEKKFKKVDSPEVELSKETRVELLSKLKLLAEQKFGDVNLLDLFMDADGNIPMNLDKISNEEIENKIKELEK